MAAASVYVCELPNLTGSKCSFGHLLLAPTDLPFDLPYVIFYQCSIVI